MQQILIDVDELRRVSTLSVESAQTLDEANAIIGTVVSQHDWKCPERVVIDEALETIKTNVLELSDSFNDFASKITEIANTYTDFINSQVQMNTAYMHDLAGLLGVAGIPGHSIGGNPFSGYIIRGQSQGGQVSQVLNSLEENSLDTANISSLHGASVGAQIVDFSTISGD